MTDPAVSADGRLVAFAGRAGDASGLYLYDRSARKTVRLETTVAGEAVQGEFREVAMSADASRIVFTTGRFDTAGTIDPTAQVWLHDRRTARTSLISATADGKPGNARSEEPAISADGRLVAFTTHATDLAAGTSGEGGDIVARDLANGRIENVSGAMGASSTYESWGASLNADGRQVAFVTTQPNLAPSDPHDQTDAFVRDRVTKKLWHASAPGKERAGRVSEVSISADGNRAAYTRVVNQFRTEEMWGAFVHDRRTKQKIAVDLDSQGNRLGFRVSSPQLSADGRLVTFSSDGSKEAVRHSRDVFVRDLKFGNTRELSVGAGLVEGSANSDAAISADGRRVVFANESFADTDGSLLSSSLWSYDLGPAPTTSSSGLTNMYLPRIAPSQKKVRTRAHQLKVVAPGEWEEVLGMRLKYQWVRNGRAIKGATKKTFTVRKRDIGARISVRESAYVPGLKTTKVRSKSIKVARSDTYFLARAVRSEVKVNTPLTLRIRVSHYDGNAPQGKIKVIIGKRVVKTADVDKDGRMRLKVRGVRVGSHTVKVRHTATSFVNSGGTVELQAVVSP